MNFEKLTQIIEVTNSSLQKKALSNANQLLVIRNWLIGFSETNLRLFRQFY